MEEDVGSMQSVLTVMEVIIVSVSRGSMETLTPDAWTRMSAVSTLTSVGHMQTVPMWREASGAAVSQGTMGTLQLSSAVMWTSAVKTCISAVIRLSVDQIPFA